MKLPTVILPVLPRLEVEVEDEDGSRISDISSAFVLLG